MDEPVPDAGGIDRTRQYRERQESGRAHMGWSAGDRERKRRLSGGIGGVVEVEVVVVEPAAGSAVTVTRSASKSAARNQLCNR